MWLGLFLVVFHFAVPFLLLLSREFKRNRKWMAMVAGWMICIRIVELFWLTGFEPHWLDVAAPVGLGGIWVAAFFRQLKQRPLLPLHDPRFPELLEQAQKA